jgi:hypothetical protein
VLAGRAGQLGELPGLAELLECFFGFTLSMHGGGQVTAQARFEVPVTMDPSAPLRRPVS